MTKIKATVERINGYCNLPLKVGDCFFVEDSRLTIPPDQHVCIWALQSMMLVFPIMAARDKLGDRHWIKKVDTFSCPDPKGLVQYRLEVLEEPAEKSD